MIGFGLVSYHVSEGMRMRVRIGTDWDGTGEGTGLGLGWNRALYMTNDTWL